ncbi:hypothetical protein ABL78_1748 [Leptomonas seymouri]|uniref:Uncharacterized protein n=1 Tax=Leptomonas seymouri TaxID=5684 RepID=A0A0N1PD38_LEPSE|nr:hypothetical protein ABL78_1748 [Leptomonas seymouri]|eukprot:KPI89104.1 hypothetical protein ABL78_1748 [Leptomonas seymouri]
MRPTNPYMAAQSPSGSGTTAAMSVHSAHDGSAAATGEQQWVRPRRQLVVHVELRVGRNTPEAWATEAEAQQRRRQFCLLFRPPSIVASRQASRHRRRGRCRLPRCAQPHTASGRCVDECEVVEERVRGAY